MKQALIYFTNQDQLVKKLDIFSAPEFDTYISYDCGERKVVLVYDKLSLAEFRKQVWQQLNISDQHLGYYVYHTHPGIGVKDFLNQHTLIKGAEEDIHELIGDHISQYYIKLQPILDAGILSDDLFETCWEQFDQDALLDSVLEDLHQRWKDALGDNNAMQSLKTYREELLAKL